jgi:hypothetical protein
MGGAAMTASIHGNGQIGVELADRLGLRLRREGHDLAGPCIACKSSDAFRLHQQTGVAHCFSCQGKWSPFQVAETVLQDRERAKALLVELGVFKPAWNNTSANHTGDPVEAIARQKGISPESLKAFGASTLSATVISLPAYGPDGMKCTTFTMSTQGGKGLFAKGKNAGLFFPHIDGKVRLPQAGEVWHLVEGPKDAAALHGLSLLACGMNTCRLAAKFTRLFAGVEMILIPDRDRAGEEGSKFSARVLRGVAKSVRIAVLPAEFKETGGEDVRDVLRQATGRELVLQAITDARQPDGWETGECHQVSRTATAEIPLPEGEPLILEVLPAGRQQQRLVVATRGETEHRDHINTDSGNSRERFIKKLATKIRVDRDTLVPLIEAQLTKLADEIDEKKLVSPRQPKDEAQSQATLAANMAADWELWHTPAKEAYATILINDHKEHWLVRSLTVKRFVAKQYFDEYGMAMNSDALAAAVNLLEAKALFEGEEHSVYVRMAEHKGNFYLDLCNSSWQAVQITPKGWSVIENPPIRFRRSRGMLPLPAPEPGGDINLLREFLNVDENSWRLVISWLVASFRSRGPYPILALFGEQGSGKSTAGRLLRDLVDPNSALLRAAPQNGRDLMIAANNSWCMAFDNLSYVPPWLSDSLCRLSSGGGFAMRELYTDEDEVIFDSQRPVLLTSIEEVATRSDLLDRSEIVWLSEIPKNRRRSEEELFEEFRKVRPLILGALLNAVAVALRRLPSIKLPELPRMADFALFATAAETAFGWPEGAFMEAYDDNRASANDVAIEASVIAQPLLELLEQNGEWEGSSTELLKELEDRVSEQIRRAKEWPKTPRALTGHLKRLAPNLRKLGWSPERDRKTKKRTWIIRHRNDSNGTQDDDMDSEPSSEPSQQTSCNSMQSHADCGGLLGDDANDGYDGTAGQRWNPDRY